MLKPNSSKIAANNAASDLVAAFLASGKTVTVADKPAVASGIKKRKYLVGKQVYGVYQMKKEA